MILLIQHELITPFSLEWCMYNLITVAFIVGIILIGKTVSSKNKNRLSLGLAILFIFEFVFMELYHHYTNTWIITDSLPLHLCGLMWFVSIYILITKKQWAFEMMLFIGMPGGLHSLLTPELTHGNDLLHKIDFFVGHGGLVLIPFYCIFVLDMWPRKYSWLNSFLKLQVLVVIVFLANLLINYLEFGSLMLPNNVNNLTTAASTSNYMYLLNPPLADNPLIPPETSFFGKWPYYILIFELAVFLHALIINLPFLINGKNRHQPT